MKLNAAMEAPTGSPKRLATSAPKTAITAPTRGDSHNNFRIPKTKDPVTRGGAINSDVTNKTPVTFRLSMIPTPESATIT